MQNNSDQACLISFGADGASVMSGEYAGVAQLLKSHFNWLIYTHCTAHRLNLVVNDLIKTSILATDVMSLINSLYNFLNIAKVQIEYEKNYKEANPKSQVKNITQQIEIRWACKFEGIDFVLKNINVIHMVLIKIMNAEKGSFKSKHVETAFGIYHKLLSGKFVVSMVTLHNYLKELYYLNKELQAEKINWTDVNFEILRTRQAINIISDDLILKNSQEICDHLKINLSLTVPLSVHNTRSTATQTDATNYVKETVNILNSQLKEKVNKEFDVRFEDKVIEVMKSIVCFDAGNSEHYLDVEMLKCFSDHFSCIEINHSILEMEVERAKKDFQLGIPINPNRADNLIKLISIKDSIATSTASVERAFSGMNRICSKLRTSISPQNLSALLCVSLNKDILANLDINDLINKWSSKKSRRFIL